MSRPGASVRLDALLSCLGMPMALPPIPEKDLIAAMGMDKKSEGCEMRVIALETIGKCFIYRTSASFFTGICSI